MAVTAGYLVWASGSASELALSAARLGEIEAHEFHSPLIEDSGLEVTGFRLGGGDRESWFLPLDDGSVATEFRQVLLSSLEA